MAQDVGRLVASLGLDATEFREGMAEASRGLTVLRSDLRASEAALGPMASGMDGLRARSVNLTQQIQLQSQRVQTLTNVHQRAVDQYGATSREAQNLEIRLNNERTALGRLETQLQQTNQQMQDLESQSLLTGQNIERLGERVSKAGQGLKTIGQNMSLYVTAPIVAAGGVAVKLASDMQESINKVDVAFKTNSGEVKKWSEDTLKSFGIAQGTALDMAALFGDMATGQGLATDAAADMSTKLVGLAGDLASFKNIRIDVAQTALKSIFTGETESLKELGIVMTQANLEQFAMSKGITKNIQDMTEAEKVQLRYAFVVDRSKNAVGDFARTGGGSANQMRIFQESMKELAVSFGNILLPTFTQIITKVNEVIQWFGQFNESTKKIILVILGVVAVIGPLLIVFGQIAIAIGAILPLLPALGGALTLLTGPVGLVIAAVAGLVAGITYLWNTNEAFRVGVIAIWENIKQVAMDIFKFLTDFWTAEGDKVKNALTQVWQVIWSILEPIWNTLKEVAIKVFGDLQSFWATWGGTITTIFKDTFRLVWESIELVFGIIKKHWDAWGPLVIAILKTSLDVMKELFLTAWNIIKVTVETAINLVKNIIQLALNIITGDWSGAWENIKNIFSTYIDFITGIAGSFKDGFVGIFTAIGSNVKAVWDGIVNAIRGSVNMIIDLANTAINQINKIPGVDVPNIPKIPAKAAGDNNWRGGLVQVHEKGGEILNLPRGTQIIPHDVSMEMARQAGSSAAGVVINNTFNSPKALDESTINRMMKRENQKLQLMYSAT